MHECRPQKDRQEDPRMIGSEWWCFGKKLIDCAQCEFRCGDSAVDRWKATSWYMLTLSKKSFSVPGIGGLIQWLSTGLARRMEESAGCSCDSAGS